MKRKRGCRSWLGGVGLMGLTSLAGCSQLAPLSLVQPAPVARAAAPQAAFRTALPSAPAGGMLLPPEDAGVTLGFQPQEVKAFPIALDTVLRLAQDQNGKVAIAREQLREAFAGKDLAAKSWMPDLFLGTNYYRHDGGIQNFNGDLVNSNFGSAFAGTELRTQMDLREIAFKKIDAERKVLQQKGQLSKLTYENLLDAANTYVDLLAARQGEAIARELDREIQALFVKAQDIAKVNPGARVEVERIRTQMSAQAAAVRKLEEGAKGAAAKLIYLLGLDPDAELVVIDQRLVAFNLVNDDVPVNELVERALTSGPGIREMQGLLALLDEAREKARGPGRLLPILQVNAADGAFGAGPGGSSTWNNRFDLVVQARWNLTEFLTSRERSRMAASKMQQAHLNYQDLRAKLILGVQEAREASMSGRDQARLGEAQIRNAREAYKLSYERFKNSIPGAFPSEVLLSIGSVGNAQINYLNALRDHDKAQLRLFILTGQVDSNFVEENCHAR